jgi:hypothetical protein
MRKDLSKIIDSLKVTNLPEKCNSCRLTFTSKSGVRAPWCTRYRNKDGYLVCSEGTKVYDEQTKRIQFAIELKEKRRRNREFLKFIKNHLLKNSCADCKHLELFKIMILSKENRNGHIDLPSITCKPLIQVYDILFGVCNKIEPLNPRFFENQLKETLPVEAKGD